MWIPTWLELLNTLAKAGVTIVFIIIILIAIVTGANALAGLIRRNKEDR